MSAYHKAPEFAFTWPDCRSWFPKQGPSGAFILALALLLWLLRQWGFFGPFGP